MDQVPRFCDGKSCLFTHKGPSCWYKNISAKCFSKKPAEEKIVIKLSWIPWDFCSEEVPTGRLVENVKNPQAVSRKPLYSLLEGEFILQRQKVITIAFLSQAVPFPEWFYFFFRSLRSHSQLVLGRREGLGQIQLHGRSACGGNTSHLPPLPEGWGGSRGQEAAGAHGLNTTRWGQEHSAHRNSTARLCIPARTRGRWGRMKVNLRKGSGQSHRLSQWEAAFHGWILNHCWVENLTDIHFCNGGHVWPWYFVKRDIYLKCLSDSLHENNQYSRWTKFSIPEYNGSTMKQVYFRKYPFVLLLFFSYIC